MRGPRPGGADCLFSLQSRAGSWRPGAVVASRQLPSANKLVLAGLTGARPELELYLEEAQFEAGTNDFEAVISRTVQLYNEALKAPAK